MTFNEYLNQEKPRFMPKVEIHLAECSHHKWCGKRLYVGIQAGVKPWPIEYVLPEAGEPTNYSKMLWTTDHDGNDKHPSVFHLVELPALPPKT